MLITEVFNEYLSYASFYLESETHKGYKKDIKLLMQALKDLDIYYVSQIPNNIMDQLNRWIIRHTNKKNSKTNDTVATFFAALTHCNIDTSFIRQYKLKDDTTGFKAIPADELKILLRYLKKLDLTKTNNLTWVLCVYIMLDTGVRMNELLNIKTKNVDIDGRKIILETTKANKVRVVPFGDLSADLIKENYDSEREYFLWNYYSNTRMSSNSLFKFLMRTSKKLNLNSGNITSHRFRKTFATRFLRSGCPITTIQRLLGHSDIRTTMIYLEIDDQMVEKDYMEYYTYNKIKKVKI